MRGGQFDPKIGTGLIRGQPCETDCANPSFVVSLTVRMLRELLGSPLRTSKVTCHGRCDRRNGIERSVLTFQKLVTSRRPLHCGGSCGGALQSAFPAGLTTSATCNRCAPDIAIPPRESLDPKPGIRDLHVTIHAVPTRSAVLDPELDVNINRGNTLL